MYRASYLVDLSGIEFDEAGTWIQAMPLGSYEHPIHGTIDITPERVKQFAANVKAKVRGQDLDIDYDHKSKRDDASGWVKDADARTDGLWLFVEWTKEGFQKLRDKAYKYFSPEFQDEWTNPANKQKYTDVLFGGALTNRPFLKGILPINLSEVFDNATQEPEGVGMDPKELRKQLGLAEDATDEQVTAKIAELNTRPVAKTPEEVKAEADAATAAAAGGGPASGDTGTPEAIAASEELKKLSDANPAIKQLMEAVNTLGATVQKQGETIATQTTQLAEATVAKQLAELDSGPNKLTPAARDLTKKILLGEKVGENTLALAKLTSEGKATVTIGESGGGNGPTVLDENSAQKRFTDLVDAELKLNEKLDYAGAVLAAGQKDPALYEEYREEAYSFRNPIG
jgi:phage I-like protein